MSAIATVLKLTPSESSALDQLAAVHWHMTPLGAARAIVLAKLYESMEAAAHKVVTDALGRGDDQTDLSAARRQAAVAYKMREKGWLDLDDPDRLPLPEPTPEP